MDLQLIQLILGAVFFLLYSASSLFILIYHKCKLDWTAIVAVIVSQIYFTLYLGQALLVWTIKEGEDSEINYATKCIYLFIYYLNGI